MPNKASDLWWLFSRQTVSVTQSETVLNAAILMQKRNFRHLPVIIESGKIVGVISAQDIIDSLSLVLRSHSTTKEIVTSLDIPVHRIMTLHTIVVEPGDGLTEVTKKMAYQNLGALPVVDEQGVVQGIITLRDLVGLIGISSDPLNVQVSEIMNTKVTFIDPESSMSEAVQLMSERRVRRLPIVSRKGNLLGMLTNKDILRHLARAAASGSADDEQFDKRISEFMTREVIMVSQDDDIRVAASRMMIFGVGGLGVEDLPSSGIALITERDLIRSLSAKRSIEFLVSAMQFELEAQNAAYHPRVL